MTWPAFLGLDWLRGGYALLAVLAVPLVLLGLAGTLRSRAVLRATFSPLMRRRTAPEASGTRRMLRVVLASAAVALFSFALSGPVLGYLERPALRVGLDLVLCLDTSRSMLARDVRPDRLTRAKREVLGLFNAA
ncbi:MAG: VWA domain-containing protein, partial [Planctomycetota bacterium]